MRPAISNTISSIVTSELRFADEVVTEMLTLRVSPTARSLKLRIDTRTGAVVLTVPRRMSRQRALAWAAGQRAWIEGALARLPAPERIAAGGTVPLYGRPHVIDWAPDRPRTIRIDGDRIVTGGPAETLEPRLTRWLKRHALDLLTAETAEYAGKAGVAVSKVGMGDPVSRWGSCSSAGAIRYSWRLILAPPHVRRHTVAHEVAHRVHMNHGPVFHALVAELFEGDPAEARAWLRREGARLLRFGRSL
jgi:predicted metal-dependent hydrolase